MIFYDNDTDSDKSNNSVIYNNSYDSKDSMYLSYLNHKEKEFSYATSTINTSCNTSRDNSYKSQSYFDTNILNINKNNESKYSSYKSQSYIEKIRYDKFKRIQKKNSKLKYKLVLNELFINKIKDLLYKSNYNIVIKELENKELKKYYKLGIIHEKFIKSIGDGLKPIIINKERDIEIAKKQIKSLTKKGRYEVVEKLEKYYNDKYGDDFKNDTKK